MDRTIDYEISFKNFIMQCPAENAYICDIQGFQRICEDKFIFKEISFLNVKKTALPTVYLFKPPIMWEELSAEERCMAQWTEKFYHGIAWDAGDIAYSRLHHILRICTEGVERLFVKGQQKVQWLSTILPNM